MTYKFTCTMSCIITCMIKHMYTHIFTHMSSHILHTIVHSFTHMWTLIFKNVNTHFYTCLHICWVYSWSSSIAWHLYIKFKIKFWVRYEKWVNVNIRACLTQKPLSPQFLVPNYFPKSFIPQALNKSNVQCTNKNLVLWIIYEFVLCIFPITTHCLKTTNTWDNLGSSPYLLYTLIGGIFMACKV